MPVTEGINRNSGQRIQIALARGIEKKTAFTAHKADGKTTISIH
jgi:hypothetical protein